MKQSKDIELLLQWAVNEELPKGQDVMKPVWKSIEEYARHSSAQKPMYQTASGDRTGGGNAPGVPHPDALVIARLLKGFDRRVGLHERALIVGLLGTLVNIDPICVDVAKAVMPNLAGLMMTCATLKRRPDLDLRHPRPCAVKRKNGTPLVLREDADGDLIEAVVKNWRNDFVGAPRCPIEWLDPRPEKLAEQRAEYTLWWRSLALLADQINALPVGEGMQDFLVTRPQCAARPWSILGARAPRILVAA